MEVEWDPQKAAQNLRRHGVGFEEATTCLLDPDALAREDELSEGESRWVLVGMSARLRLLTVVYTSRDDDRIRLISARRSSKKEGRHYA